MKVPTMYYARYYNKNSLKPTKYKIGFMCFGHSKSTVLGVEESIYMYDKTDYCYRTLVIGYHKERLTRDMTRNQLAII